MTCTSCRSCGDLRRCQEWTLHTKDVVIHDEGVSDQDAESISGQCDDCLKAHGPDEDCALDEEHDKEGMVEL